jgi:hypothetical protein
MTFILVAFKNEAKNTGYSYKFHNGQEVLGRTIRLLSIYYVLSTVKRRLSELPINRITGTKEYVC